MITRVFLSLVRAGHMLACWLVGRPLPRCLEAGHPTERKLGWLDERKEKGEEREWEGCSVVGSAVVPDGETKKKKYLRARINYAVCRTGWQQHSHSLRSYCVLPYTRTAAANGRISHSRFPRGCRCVVAEEKDGEKAWQQQSRNSYFHQGNVARSTKYGMDGLFWRTTAMRNTKQDTRVLPSWQEPHELINPAVSYSYFLGWGSPLVTK